MLVIRLKFSHDATDAIEINDCVTNNACDFGDLHDDNISGRF